MTIEYVLLLIVIFSIGLKAFLSAPAAAFKESGPRLGARIEQQLATGDGFKPERGQQIKWEGDQ
ncbi:hypothetical protein [Bdellovibrio sp. BCCA]|uniref:hypothetical protein n=1 Tax=unclassified Bdellovibrio TaxID=2633795 RepID=UPI0025EAE4F9|nr:hypothetical protein [uncultured Bdellovibrio sp.]